MLHRLPTPIHIGRLASQYHLQFPDVFQADLGR